MKILKAIVLSVISVLILASCSTPKENNDLVFSLSSDGYLVVNDQKTSVKISGQNGKDGLNGTNGVDGKDGTNGINGKNGVNGKDGVDGKNGETPYIGENGNWWIGSTDTGYTATNVKKDYSFTEFTELPNFIDVNYPLEVKSWNSNNVITITSMNISVRYSDFDEFLAIDNPNESIYLSNGFEKYTVKAKITGFVDQDLEGYTVQIIIQSGDWYVFDGVIAADNTFVIEKLQVNSNIDDTYVYSSIVVIPPEQ